MFVSLAVDLLLNRGNRSSKFLISEFVAEFDFGFESIGFRRTGDFSNSEAISMGIKETLRYGLFLGTFAGTFVSVDEAICSLVGHQRHAPLSLLLSLHSDLDFSVWRTRFITFKCFV